MALSFVLCVRVHFPAPRARAYTFGKVDNCEKKCRLVQVPQLILLKAENARTDTHTHKTS